ncbi:MAG: hypothetical protein ACLP9L_13740, partial [Thermoguttaceae bacterium]
ALGALVNRGKKIDVGHDDSLNGRFWSSVKLIAPNNFATAACWPQVTFGQVVGHVSTACHLRQ